ncbi:MAG: hypothetical protein CMH49_05700 [Myxococcales bacterium]|nr:hypothetical protein [Myxococcales bacterium]
MFRAIKVGIKINMYKHNTIHTLIIPIIFYLIGCGDEISDTASSPDSLQMQVAYSSTRDRQDLSQGLADELAGQACQLFDAEMTHLTMTSQRSEAGQVTILPSAENAYKMDLPDTGTGYLTLEVPDWSITIGIFTNDRVQVRIWGEASDLEEERPLSLNPSCDGMTDERIHFHAWGAYVIELIGEPNDEIQLAFIKD